MSQRVIAAEVTAIGKVAVERGITDPGATGDLVQRDMRTASGEQLVGGCDERVVAAASVSTLRRMYRTAQREASGCW